MRIFKLDFKIPKKSKIAILDFPGANLIQRTLNIDNISIISLRTVKINLLILILSIFGNQNLTKGQRYIVSFIKFIRPKMIISHIDNNQFFYNLKEIFPDVIFIFIQNGVSLAHYSENEIKKLNWKADYFFSYSKSFSKIYSSIFNIQTHTIGSFKNNLIKRKKNIKKKDLVYISQFTKSSFSNEKIKSGKRLYSRKTLFKAERVLLPIIHKFCLNNDLNLVIAGRNFFKVDSNNEEKFYRDIIFKKGDLITNFIFKHFKDEFSSYDLIDKSKMVVFIDSALGYQSLARGNKSLACCIRSNFIKNKNLKFGWPAQFKNEGLFWINSFNKKKIEKKLEVLYNFSNSKWKKVYEKHRNNLLAYDKENLTFKKIIKKLKK